MKMFIIEIARRVLWWRWLLVWKLKAGGYLRQRRNPEPARKPRLLFGTAPIINNKYWSGAMKEAGYDARSLTYRYYSINKKDDFDEYYDDIVLRSRSPWRFIEREFLIFNYVITNFDVIHIPFSSFNFSYRPLKAREAKLLKAFGVRVVVLPYGADFWQYSRIDDVSIRHVMLCNYPMAALAEEAISEDITKWVANADVVIAGFQTNGLARWDIFPYNIVIMNVAACAFSKERYTNADGKNGAVKVVHTPNHRYIKGTEYLLRAIGKLRSEGLRIDLILLENVPNDQVLETLRSHADILVEQLVIGYALSAMEAMAFGVAVLSNLEYGNGVQAFHRYSYLSECPILSTTPENIENNLRLLVEDPVLRRQLGVAGRSYVEKYHSYATAQYVFGKVYDKIWFNKNVDLINMFHPLAPDAYNNLTPPIENPLIAFQTGTLQRQRT